MTTTITPDVRTRLTEPVLEWLERERVLVEKHWTEEGISPTIAAKRVLAYRTYERTGERSATWNLQFKCNTVEVSRLRIGGGASLFFQFSTTPPANEFAEAYGMTHLLDALGDADGPEPTRRVALFFARLCYDYLQSLKTIAGPEPDIAKTVIDSYFEFLEADDVDEVEELPIGGVTQPKLPLTLATGNTTHRTACPHPRRTRRIGSKARASE